MMTEILKLTKTCSLPVTISQGGSVKNCGLDYTVDKKANRVSDANHTFNKNVLFFQR
jgi:hypothetical protein